MMASMWVKPESVSTDDSVLLGNGGGNGNGFVLRQHGSDQRLKLFIGQGDDYKDIVVADAPLTYWRMNESAGTTMVDTMGNHDGTYTNSPNLDSAGGLTSDSDSSVNFDPTSNHYSIVPNHADFSTGGALTVEAWVKIDGQCADDAIVAYGLLAAANRKWSLECDNSGATNSRIRFWIDLGATAHASGFMPVVPDTWYHVVATFDRTLGSSRLKLFLDGLFQNQVDAADSDLEASTQGVYIGTRDTAISSGFPGSIDEIAIYNRALTSAEILEHYNAGAKQCASTTTFENNKWYQIGSIWDGTNGKVFVNGREECTYAPTGVTFAGSTNLTAGATSAGANAYDGDISQLQLYSSGTAANVKTNFDATANTFRATPISGIVTDNLVLQLDPANAVQGMRANADDSCDATVKWFDLSSSGNDGTLTNFASCGDSSGWNGTGATGDPYVLAMDGANDIVDLEIGGVAAAVDAASAVTMEAWIKPDTLADAFTRQLFWTYMTTGGSTAFRLGIKGSGGTHAEVHVGGRTHNGGGFNSLDGAVLFKLGEWNHIVGTLDFANDMLYTYINGTPSTTKSVTFNPTFQDHNSQDAADRVAHYYDGDFGYLATYRDKLTDAEVAQNFSTMADRFRDHPLTGVVKEGLVLQLDAANAKDKLRGEADGTCTNTTWADLSGNGNDGTLTNFSGCGASSGWNGDGSVGDPYRLEFGSSTGGNDYADIDDLSLGDKHTLEMWVRTTNRGNLIGGSGVNHGIVWTNTSGTTLYYNTGNGAVSTTYGSLLNGAWHHLVVTRSEAAVNFYLDGTNIGSKTLGTSTEPVATLIGGRLPDLALQFVGGMNYVSFYERALSANEIKQNCNALESRFTSTPGDICAP